MSKSQLRELAEVEEKRSYDHPPVTRIGGWPLRGDNPASWKETIIYIGGFLLLFVPFLVMVAIEVL